MQETFLGKLGIVWYTFCWPFWLCKRTSKMKNIEANKTRINSSAKRFVLRKTFKWRFCVCVIRFIMYIFSVVKMITWTNTYTYTCTQLNQNISKITLHIRVRTRERAYLNTLLRLVHFRIHKQHDTKRCWTFFFTSNKLLLFRYSAKERMINVCDAYLLDCLLRAT